MSATDRLTGAVGRYIELGLGLGRHIEGFVDAYYGPPAPAARAAAAEPPSPDSLVVEARSLLAALDSGAALDDADDSDLVTASRRRWIRRPLRNVRATGASAAG